jgi:hypothetical protein
MACRNVLLLIGLGWYEIEEASRANKVLRAFGATIAHAYFNAHQDFFKASVALKIFG